MFPKGLWEYDNNCNGTFFTTSWPIPNDTLSKIDPPFHAFRLLIYNATAALATPNETGIYHFSPGFYIKQDNIASTQPEAVAIPGTDLTGKGAVKPPSGGEIAAHGAIGIGAGLFIIVVALTGQLLFLEYRRTRIGRSQLGTWQDKMNLTDVSQVDTKRENRVNYNKPLPPTPPGSRLDSPVSALSVMTVPERRLGYTAGTNEQ